MPSYNPEFSTATSPSNPQTQLRSYPASSRQDTTPRAADTRRSMAPTSNAEPPNASSSIAPQDLENLAQNGTERPKGSGGGVANLHPLREEWTAASENGSGNEASDHRDSSDGTERSSTADSSAATPGTRIAQYEALGGAKLFHGGRGQGFIVARTNYDGKTGSAISKFPAELLAHLFSYMEPASLLTTSLTSRRFHAIASSPQVWRLAFTNYFPPPPQRSVSSSAPSIGIDKRSFTRVSACPEDQNPWRHEFIHRVKLLKAYTKGRLPSPKHNQKYAQSNGALMQSYKLLPWHHDVSHMAANFRAHPNSFRVIHASLDSQTFSASNPVAGKSILPGRFKLASPDNPLRDIQPQHSVAVDMGVNRVLCVSEELGWVMGENVPGGRFYVHFNSNPYLLETETPWNMGGSSDACITSVWMANKHTSGVYETTNNQVLFMIGNSRGVLSVFTIEPGSSEPVLVADWCVSPGIPIVQIRVDDDYSHKRRRQGKPWLLVVNALGELYYLRGSPSDTSPLADWKSAKQPRVPSTVYHALFKGPEHGLSRKEYYSKLMKMDYDIIAQLWEGFRMDWFVEVDWVGRNFVLGCTGNVDYWSKQEMHTADIPIKRLHLKQLPGPESTQFVSEDSKKHMALENEKAHPPMAPNPSLDTTPSSSSDQWVISELVLPLGTFSRITSHAIDNTDIARTTEPSHSLHQAPTPGHNGRLFALGTNTGDIFIFNIRPTTSSAAPIHPIRTIFTRSPSITTLAVSPVAVIHGGIDGLVQVWDPLNSTPTPLRTLSEPPRHAIPRPSAPPPNVDVSHPHKARCLLIDPDPTRLRGVVACGTMIRYWSFTLDTGPPKKRRRKRVAPPSGAISTARARSELQTGIAAERETARLQAAEDLKRAVEEERRYGLIRGEKGLSEEEMVAYAQMISRETFEQEVPAESPTPAENEDYSEDEELRRVLELSERDARAEIGTPENVDEYEDEDEELLRALKLSMEQTRLADEPTDRREHVVAGPSNLGTATAPAPSESQEPEFWPTLQEAEERSGMDNTNADEREFARQMELAIQASMAEVTG